MKMEFEKCPASTLGERAQVGPPWRAHYTAHCNAK